MSFKWAESFDLGMLSEEEKEELRSDFTYKKTMNDLMREGRAAAKGSTCYYCGKESSSFCNSHSIPAFCLRNIAASGQVLTPNAMIDFPLMDIEKGVNKAGTFQIICRDCDSHIFSDYENPANYTNPPTSTMIAQIALKNALRAISKRKFETELFNVGYAKSGRGKEIVDLKNSVNALDLAEYVADFNRAKKAIEKNHSSDYQLFFYEQLNYVVPIAFQCELALVFDFEGNIINYIYNTSPDYKVKSIHLCVFPLESHTAIIMFADSENKRYRKFIKQFNRLTHDDKLAALTFIMFAYSEDIFFAKQIQQIVTDNPALCEASRSSQDVLSSYLGVDPYEVIRENYDLSKRHSIPNLLSEEYKLR